MKKRIPLFGIIVLIALALSGCAVYGGGYGYHGSPYGYGYHHDYPHGYYYRHHDRDWDDYHR